MEHVRGEFSWDPTTQSTWLISSDILPAVWDVHPECQNDTWQIKSRRQHLSWITPTTQQQAPLLFCLYVVQSSNLKSSQNIRSSDLFKLNPLGPNHPRPLLDLLAKETVLSGSSWEICSAAWVTQVFTLSCCFFEKTHAPYSKQMEMKWRHLYATCDDMGYVWGKNDLGLNLNIVIDSAKWYVKMICSSW